jgi:Arc/MetJ family transcription regulator
MRTNIDIDDKLMKQAMKATGATTKKGAVVAAMQLAVQLHKQGEAIRQLRGLGWEGDLKRMRASRYPDWDQQPRQKPRRLRAPAA